MRVVHVAECVGGVERYLQSLLKYSKCENIVILSQRYNKDNYESLASHVEIVNMFHGIRISALKEAFKIRKLIKKYNPDIVYAHSSIAGAITRLACLGLKCKVIYNPHGWAFNMEKSKKELFVMLERIMAIFCDAIICISDAEKVSAVRERICNKNKLHVIYNGIDFDEHNNNNNIINLNIPENNFVVGMVGRICKQKAPDIFVRMAAKVKKQIKNTYFIIVGDVLEGREDEKQEIIDLAKELGVNLYITGWVKNPLDYVSCFDVGCLFSRWEGFGLVIPEYMFSKVPIVATKVDAIPYLIEDGIDGMLVEKDDWNTAAERVMDLLLNEDLKNRIVKNEYITVTKRFDAKRVSKECEELYYDLLD